MKTLLAVLLISIASTVCYAKVVPNSRIFIAPMEGNFNGFIAAEMLKRKVPLQITTDEKKADYVMVGTAVTSENKWYHIFQGGARDKMQGNVQVLDVKNRSLVWAGATGDRSFWWGAVARGGQRKMALRIVKKMKKDLFSKKALKEYEKATAEASKVSE